ncbi:SIS domain-containing protein [Tahibacter harae]|uniref:SIS domain-containing protein n=1 Tax=Tahibacter harae TaxID=2963937 RepID=A0ABT1QYE5_9GAMM|nr:SIS domain-containing protein [Tahibacter harae]MCQ4167314.1 SIS domain-containing protein [Tahibacter harae]
MAVNPSLHSGGALADLLAAAPAQQTARGYADTLREILQQPETWTATAQQLSALLTEPAWREALDAAACLVLTGSGSSHYVGEVLANGLQARLGKPVLAVPAGTLLTHWRGALPAGALLVSFARSGDSPESLAVAEAVFQGRPECRHLAITCNAQGGLARRYRERDGALAAVLDARTNDRSLVMTSSFTNLVLAGRSLAFADDTAAYRTVAQQAAQLCRRLFAQYADAIAAFAAADFDDVCYLGSGAHYGAARESALKMLEMTGGEVRTLAETFLGLRHGPMSALRRGTALVAFVSGDAAVRDYELHLLRELRHKGLAVRRLLLGENLPPDSVGADDLCIDLPGLCALGDDAAALLGAVAGQLLAFFRCLQTGHRPDAPSQGVLTRVVPSIGAGGRSPA